MSRLYKTFFALAAILLLAAPGFGQSNVFIVDDDGNPATTYPDLATAIATAETYPAPPYKIMVMPGNYTDEGLTVDETKIDEIYGDPGSLPGDIVFTGSGSAPLITVDGAFTIKNLYLTGYTHGIRINDASGVMIDGVVFEQNAQGVLVDGTVTGSSGCTVQNSSFIDNSAYGVQVWFMSGSNTIQDNCFVGNNGGGVQGYDSNGTNTWDNNFFDDYAGGSYALDGGASASDANPAPYGVKAVVASPQELGAQFTVQFEIVFPACAYLADQMVGAFDFTVSWNNAKVNYVPGTAEYIPYFGDDVLETDVTVGTNSLGFAAVNITNPGPGAGLIAQADFEAVAANTGNTFVVTTNALTDQTGLVDYPTSGFNTVISLIDNTAPTLAIAANNPVGDDTYSDGSTAGAGPFVELHMAIDAADDWDLDRLEFHYDGNAWATWVGGLSGMAFVDTLYAGGAASLTEDDHSLWLRVVDAAGNPSDSVEYAFTMDRTGPVLSSVLHLDPDCIVDTNYTNDGSFVVELTTADLDVDAMEFWEDLAPGWQGKVAFAASSMYTLLDSTEANRQIYARLYDKYNNMGNQDSDFINYDVTAPGTTQDFALSPTVKTADTAITGDVTAFSAPLYLWSEDQGDLVCGGDWLTSPTHPFNVYLQPGDGDKIVYFSTMDLAGNMSPIQADTVELDQIGPDLISFSVADLTGSECSDSWTVEVTVEWDTLGDAKRLYLREDTIGAYTANILLTGQSSPYTFNYTITDTDCDTLNGIYARLRDDVNNFGPPLFDEIFVDCAAPSFTSGNAVDLNATDAPVFNDNWTNEADIKIVLNGVAADVVAVEVSEDGGSNWSEIPVASVTDPLEVQYTATGFTECTFPINFDVRVKDCADRVSASATYDLVFDLSDPVIDTFYGPAATNNLTVNLNLTASDACSAYPPAPSVYRISEGAGTIDTATWQVFDATPTFVLEDKSPASNDGNRDVYVQVADKAGNMSGVEMISIEVDMTAPTGTFALESTNPMAADGWTNTRYINVIDMAWDADVNAYQIRNNDAGAPAGTGLTTVSALPLADDFLGWQTTGTWGTKTVQMRFRDDANNWGSWVSVNIVFNNATPPPPASASGMPVASTELTWDGVVDAQAYIIRYNFAGDYPLYDGGVPPHPLTLGQGILEDTVWGAEMYDFVDHDPDLYAFSIWTIGLNGNTSATPNTDVVATNYILGDFFDSDAEALGPDGCLSFLDEFVELATAYNSSFGDANFNDLVDIGPTFSGDPMSYPIPDDAIDFEDLIIFGINYDGYRCGAKKVFYPGDDGPSKLVAGPIALTAEVPQRIEADRDYMLTFRVDDPTAIKGYHLVLDYNEADFELIEVKQGEIFSSVEKSFFYYDKSSSDIDVTGMVLGPDAYFAGQEMFTVTLRARNNAPIELQDVELTVRDRENEDIQVAFSVTSSSVLPTSFELSQNYPNPFNPTTNIDFSLPVASDYKLTIFNVLGQVVSTFEGYSEAGILTITWDASNVSSGIYLYKMEAGSFEATRKMVLLK